MLIYYVYTNVILKFIHDHFMKCIAPKNLLHIVSSLICPPFCL